MNTAHVKTWCLLAASAAMLFRAEAARDITIDYLLKKLEEQQKMVSDVQARVVLTQQREGQGAKAFDMIYYRRDKDNSFLIVMTAPEAEKGNGYLRVDDNFWMYRRNTRTFQHINRDESIGGSDARGDDFETRRITELFGPKKDAAGKEMLGEEMLGKIPVYRFEVEAKVNDVDYPHKIYWLQKDRFLVLKEQALSSSGTLMQTVYYLKYTEIDGKFIPVKHLYIDEFEKGNKTIVEISGISTEKLTDDIFTKAYLENLSK
jgi:outer membrane lipoprotein-sorting protein